MGTEELLAEQVAYYRARASEYDDWWERRGGYDLGEQATRAWQADAALLRHALDEFGPRGQVLELAAGTGIWTGELLRHADRVLAVDAAPEVLAINHAKHAGRPVDYVVADLFAWAPPRRFDVVCFTFWLSHVPAAHWSRFWALVDQALAPGGRVWFCDNAHPEHAAAHGPRAVRGRGDRPELAGERRERRLQDGRAFQIVKRYWHPLELQTELAAIGWHAEVVPPRGRSSRAGQPAPRIKPVAQTARRFASRRRFSFAAASPPGSCQRGKWSSQTGLTLPFRRRPSLPRLSRVVLAARATPVPYTAVLNGPQRTTTDNTRVALSCADSHLPRW